MDKPSKSSSNLILVVEDDADHRKTLTSILAAGGYEIAAVNDGLQALERLRWGLRPSAILLDMRMLVMNGWDFRRELSRNPAYSSIPVLIMSGGPLRPDDVIGSAGWITKPVDRTDLLEKIEVCTRPQGA